MNELDAVNGYSHKTEAAIKYLLNNLAKDGFIGSILIENGLVTINGKEVNVDLNTKNTDCIANIINIVGDEFDICLDCMTEDNLEMSDYLANAIKAYLGVLCLNYGPDVKISTEMTKFLIRHNLIQNYYIYKYYIHSSSMSRIHYEHEVSDEDNLLLTADYYGE